MAYEDMYQIALAFMQSYYQGIGFARQKEELEFQRGITERQTVLAEKQFGLQESNAELQQELLRIQTEIAKSGEARAQTKAEQEGVIFDLEKGQLELNAQYAETLLKDQLAANKQSIAYYKALEQQALATATDKEKDLTDAKMNAINMYNAKAPLIMTQLGQGTYQDLVTAFESQALDIGLLPDEQTYTWYKQQVTEGQPDYLGQYIRKLLVDSAIAAFAGLESDTEFIQSFGTQVQALPTPPIDVISETPGGRSGGLVGEAGKAWGAFSDSMERIFKGKKK